MLRRSRATERTSPSRICCASGVMAARFVPPRRRRWRPCVLLGWHANGTMSDEPKDPKEKIPGRLARTLKTAWLGGAVGSSYLGGKLMDRWRGDERRGEAEL